jgi:hypothetical protein
MAFYKLLLFMSNFPELFKDVGNEIQFSDPLQYKAWVISKSTDIFNTEKTDSISDMMLVHQILYPQIKRISFNKQLAIVLKMSFTIVRANRVKINSILTGAAIESFGLKSLLN